MPIRLFPLRLAIPRLVPTPHSHPTILPAPCRTVPTSQASTTPVLADTPFHARTRPPSPCRPALPLQFSPFRRPWPTPPDPNLPDVPSPTRTGQSSPTIPASARRLFPFPTFHPSSPRLASFPTRRPIPHSCRRASSSRVVPHPSDYPAPPVTFRPRPTNRFASGQADPPDYSLQSPPIPTDDPRLLVSRLPNPSLSESAPTILITPSRLRPIPTRLVCSSLPAPYRLPVSFRANSCRLPSSCRSNSIRADFPTLSSPPQPFRRLNPPHSPPPQLSPFPTTQTHTRQPDPTCPLTPTLFPPTTHPPPVLLIPDYPCPSAPIRPPTPLLPLPARPPIPFQRPSLPTGQSVPNPFRLATPCPLLPGPDLPHRPASLPTCHPSADLAIPALAD